MIETELLKVVSLISVYFFFRWLLSVDVDAKVAVVLNKGILDDNGAFPKVLYQYAIVHILSDLTIGYLYRHRKLF